MLDKAAPLAPARPRENLLSHLDRLGVKFQLNSKVLEIMPDGIRFEKDGEEGRLTGFSSIVLAFGSRPDTALWEELSGKEGVYRIGDALKAGDAKKGIYEATKLALE